MGRNSTSKDPGTIVKTDNRILKSLPVLKTRPDMPCVSLLICAENLKELLIPSLGPPSPHPTPPSLLAYLSTTTATITITPTLTMTPGMAQPKVENV